MNAREKLDEFAEIMPIVKTKLIGWSVAADFAEWFSEKKNEELQEQVRKLREGLGDCDTLLSHLEDHTHGDDGKMITEQRGNIQQLLTETEG